MRHRAELTRWQDECLIRISDGKPVRAEALQHLPPWRAVLIARVADKAGIPLEDGTLDQLVAEANRAGGAGVLVWPPTRLPSEKPQLSPDGRGRP